MVAKGMGKKGVFFTFVSILVIILILSVVSTRKTQRYTAKSDAIATRIQTMDNFITDFENDFEREILIGGYRALLSMNAYIRQTESYITDIDSIYFEILMNGTANGTSMSLMQQDTQGAGINEWVSRIQEEADPLHIQVNIDVYDITISHVSPWDVEVLVNTTVIINDTKGLVTWVYDNSYRNGFSILGFEDPLYTVETNDKVTNLVNVTIYDTFVGINNDTTNIQDHVLQSFYIASNTSPSFLMRYTGNFNASPYGIESFVSVLDLNAQGILIKERSLIDYLYFGNQTDTGVGNDVCNMTQMPSWFRIHDDADYLDTYELSALDAVGC